MAGVAFRSIEITIRQEVCYRVIYIQDQIRNDNLHQKNLVTRCPSSHSGAMSQLGHKYRSLRVGVPK